MIATCLQERYAKGPDSDCTTTLVTHSLRGEGFDASEDGTGRGTPFAGAFGVRRLTPRECERLQGFPDDFTLIDFRGKPAKDSPRYKALGNSMAVSVIRWIGNRIMEVDSLDTGGTECPQQPNLSSNAAVSTSNQTGAGRGENGG